MFKTLLKRLFYIIPTISFIISPPNLLANEEVIQEEKKEILYIKDIPNNQFTDYARIQILDKIMANSTEIDIKISEIYPFNNLSILIHKCWKSKPEDKPENKSLMTIKEYIKSNNEEKTIFNGWIFSSSPSISSIENVIYDITLIKCFNKDED